MPSIVAIRVPCSAVLPSVNARPHSYMAVTEMAASIAALGVLTPLVVEQVGPERYRVMDGDLRLLGARACEKDGKLPEGTIPVLVEEFANAMARGVRTSPLTAYLVDGEPVNRLRIVDGYLRMRAMLDLGGSVPLVVPGVGEVLVATVRGKVIGRTASGTEYSIDGF